MIKDLKPIKSNNKGETLVEIMVAFIVLTTVIAIFTGAVSAASSAVTKSIDNRHTSDTGYTDLQKNIETESSPGVNSDDPANPAIYQIDEADGLTGSDINLNAYKYTSGGTVYWVFR